MVESSGARLSSALPFLVAVSYHATIARWGTSPFAPPLPTHVDRVIIAVLAGQVAPGATSTFTVEHGLKSQAVVDLTLKAREPRRNGKPFQSAPTACHSGAKIRFSFTCHAQRHQPRRQTYCEHTPADREASASPNGTNVGLASSVHTENKSKNTMSCVRLCPFASKH